MNFFLIFFILTTKSQILKIYINNTRTNCTNICKGSKDHPFSNFIMGVYEGSKIYQNLFSKPLELHFILIGNIFFVFDIDVFNYTQKTPLELLSNIKYNCKIFIYPSVCADNCIGQPTEISLRTDIFTIVIPKFLKIAHILITGYNLHLNKYSTNQKLVNNCIYTKNGCCSESDLTNTASFCNFYAFSNTDYKNDKGIGFFTFGYYSDLQEIFAEYFALVNMLDINKSINYYIAFIVLPNKNTNKIKITFNNIILYKNYFSEGIIKGFYLNELNIIKSEMLYYNYYRVRNSYYTKYFDFSIEFIENINFENNTIKQSVLKTSIKSYGGMFNILKNSKFYIKNTYFLITEKILIESVNNKIVIENCNFEISDIYYPWLGTAIFNFNNNNSFIVKDSIFYNKRNYLSYPRNYCEYLLNFISNGNAVNNTIKFSNLKINEMVNFGIVNSNLISNSNNFFYFDSIEINIDSIYYTNGAIIYLSNAIIVLKNIKITNNLKVFIESNNNKIFLCDSEIFDKNVLFKSSNSLIIMKNLFFKKQSYNFQTLSSFSNEDRVVFYKNLFIDLRIIVNLFTMSKINDFYFYNNLMKNINIWSGKNLISFLSKENEKNFAFFKNNVFDNIIQNTNSANFFLFSTYFWLKLYNETYSTYLKKITIYEFSDYCNVFIENLSIYYFYSIKTPLFKLNNNNNLIIINAIFEKMTIDVLSNLFWLNLDNKIYLNNVNISNITVNEIAGSCSGCAGIILRFQSRNKVLLINIKISQMNSNSNYLLSSILYFSSFNYVTAKNITILNVKGIKGSLISFTQQNKIIWEAVYLTNIFLPSGNFFLGERGENMIVLRQISLENIMSRIGGCVIILEKNNKLSIEYLTAYNISDISQLGAGFFLLDSDNQVLVKNATIDMLSVENQGGFILATINNNIRIVNSLFNNFIDLAIISGGLFANINTRNTIVIKNCRFSKFFESQSGNIIFATQFNLIYLDNLTMWDGVANSVNFGGGAFTLIAYNKLFLNNCNFVNLTSLFGALIYLQAKNVVLLKKLKIVKENNKIVASIFKIVLKNKIVVEDFLLNWNFLENEIKIFDINFNNTVKVKNMSFYFSLELSALKNFVFFAESENQLFLQKILLRNLKNIEFIYCKKSFVIFDKLRLENVEFLKFVLIQSYLSKITIRNLKISIDNLQNNLIYSIDSYFVLENLVIETKRSVKKMHFNIVFGKNCYFYLKKIYFISNFYSKSFLELKNSSFQINNCFFGFNNIVYNGAIVNFENYLKLDKKYKNFVIKKSIFLRNSGAEGGNLFIKITNYNEKIIEKSIFIRNKAKKGGVIFSTYFSDIIFVRNKFIKNLADKGAFIYLDKIKFENYKKNDFFSYLASNNTIFNNRFYNQSAMIGGLIFVNSFKLNLLQIIKKFTNKIKQTSVIINSYSLYYGDLIATNPIKIYLESKQFKYYQKSFNIYQKLLFSNKNCIFNLIPIDIFGNVAYGSDLVFIKEIDSNLTIKNYLKITENYLFCLLGNITKNNLNQKEINFFINNYISVYKNETKTIKNNLKFDKYNINFIFSGNCQIGERLTDLFSCVPCEKNQYSFNTDFSKISGACHPCDLKFNCFGGFNLTPKAGYSRLSKYSIKFSACPNTKACLGDNRENLNVFDSKYEIGICDYKYQGDFCSECSKGFGKSDQQTCVSCEKSNSYVKLILFLVLKLFILIYYGYKSINMAFYVISKENSYDDVTSTYLIKILTNHFQMIFLITFYQYESPAIIDDVFSFFSVVSDSSSQISFECILKNANIEIPDIFFNLIVICIEPILMLFIGFIYVKIKKKNLLEVYSVKQIDTIFCIAIIFLIFSYSQFLTIISQCFMCTNLGDKIIG